MLSLTTRLARMGPASWQVKVQACGARSWQVDSRGGGQGYVAVGRAPGSEGSEGSEGGPSLHLPVNVLVGADGDNSRVRDLANISLMFRPSYPSLSHVSPLLPLPPSLSSQHLPSLSTPMLR